MLLTYQARDVRNQKLTVKVLRVLFVNESGQISTIVQDHVQWLSLGESSEGLFDTPNVFFLGFTFPSVNWDTSSGDSCGGVILGGEDVT